MKTYEIPVFGSRFFDSCSGGCGRRWSLEEVTITVNNQLDQDFGGAAFLRYVDFDSPELKEYPEAHKRVTVDHDLEPGTIQISGELVSFFDIPYDRLTEEFMRIGAQPIRKAS